MLDTTKETAIKQRESGIELFRIISMLVIVAHHYVITSSIMGYVYSSGNLSWRNIFLILFGWGGKTAINCFVLISGYFMCKSQVTLKKFVKLLAEVVFYNVVIYLIFVISGYTEFSFKAFLKGIVPVQGIGTGFTHSFLLFYLLMPFLNILITNMKEKEHKYLVIICVTAFSLIPTVFNQTLHIGYVGWFTVLYLIASYIRLYQVDIFQKKALWGWMSLLLIGVSWGSVLLISFRKGSVDLGAYYFVSDSNRVLALATAVCCFMFFKNLDLGYKKYINVISASTFGVLQIHSNSDLMRQWLWVDLLDNGGKYYSNFLPVYAILSVLGVFVVCTIIDYLRIRFIEIPLFKRWK